VLIDVGNEIAFCLEETHGFAFGNDSVGIQEREPNMPGYYHQEDLSRFGDIGKDAPELWEKFSQYYGAVFEEGALSEREKALIALAVAHAVQCPYCIDAYTQTSLEKGSNIEQMTEAVHVAAAIKGGAALVHGLQMRNRADQLTM
jgi:alkylhydroperoxidase/carboxymuconolactone decarboxylase family protein